MRVPQEATISFINGAKGVVGAVSLLRTAVAADDPSDINFASGLLAQAADDYLGNTVTYQQKRFDEMAVAQPAALQKPERAAADLLASALVDLEVANTVLAAARAASSTPSPALLVELDTNSERLDGLVNRLALPLGREDNEFKMARFGFDEVPTAPVAMASSPDLVAAKKNFEKQAAEVFDLLVADSKKVVVEAFDSIKDLNFEQVLKSLGAVANMTSQVPKVAAVVSKALAIIARAFEKISSLLGIEHKLEAVTGVARRIQQYIQDPTRPLEDLLTLMFCVENNNKRVSELVKKTSVEKDKIDETAQELVELRARFAEQMSLTTLVINGARTANGITNFFLPSATTILIFGSFQVLAGSYAVLAGMDFADSEGSLNFVNGVMGISEAGLSQIQPES
jgi:hypothetical protein